MFMKGGEHTSIRLEYLPIVLPSLLLSLSIVFEFPLQMQSLSWLKRGGEEKMVGSAKQKKRAVSGAKRVLLN
jgi:hypothetical protein